MTERVAVVEAAPKSRIEDHHHYRYHLVDQRCGWAHWRSGELLGTVRLHGSADLFASPKAGRWWLAARRGQVIMHRRAATVPDLFGLKVVVTPPEGWRGSLAGILKTLVDGLTAALHAHDPVVDPRIPDRAALADTR